MVRYYADFRTWPARIWWTTKNEVGLVLVGQNGPRVRGRGTLYFPNKETARAKANSSALAVWEELEAKDLGATRTSAEVLDILTSLLRKGSHAGFAGQSVGLRAFPYKGLVWDLFVPDRSYLRRRARSKEQAQEETQVEE